MKTNKRFWIFRNTVVAAFAKWAVRQSPYLYPKNLEKALKILDNELQKEISWDGNGMACVSTTDIKSVLDSVVKNPFNKIFVEWNTPKKGKERQFIFTSRYDKPNPDYDIIDLDALIRNTVQDIIQEHEWEEELERRVSQSCFVTKRRKK